MKKILLFLCLCVSMSILAQNRPYKNTYTAQDYINKGSEQYVEGNFLGASRYFEKAIEIDPENYDAYCFLGQSLADVARSTSNSNGFFRKAFRAYKKATELEKNNPSAYNSWGMALTDYARRNNKLHTYAPRIKELFEKTIQLGSQYGAYNMACLYSLLNEKKNAIDWLYITMDPSFTEQMHNLGYELFEKDSDFKNINQTPAFTDFLYKYFSDYDGLVSPESGNTFFYLAGQKHAKGLCLQACRDYEKLWLHGYKHRNLVFDWASAYSAIGKFGYYKEALEIFKLAAKENPKDYRIYNDWGVTLTSYARSKNELYTYFPQIKELLEKAIELGADQSGSYNMACLYSLCNEKETAMKWLNKAVLDENKQKMKELNREKLETDSDLDNIRDLYEFKQLLWTRFYTKEEVRELNQMLKEEYNTAIALLEEGEYEEAYTYFEKRLRYMPDSYGGYHAWATGLSKQAQKTNDAKTYKASIAKFKKALRIKPDKSEGYNNFGVVLMHYANSKNKLYTYFPQIKELYEKTIEFGDQSGTYNMACLYSLCNEKANAIAWLEKMMHDYYSDEMDNLTLAKFDTDPDFDNIRDSQEFKAFLLKYFYTTTEFEELESSIDIEFTQALKFHEQKNYDAVCSYLGRINRYITENYDVYLLWANALLEWSKETNDVEKYEASIGKFKKAIELDPDRSDGYNNMGVALMDYAKSKKNLKSYSPQLKELFGKVIEMENPLGAYNMACLYSLCNDKQNAVMHLYYFSFLNFDKSGEEIETISRKEIEDDSDFENIRNSQEFKCFLDLSYPVSLDVFKLSQPRSHPTILAPVSPSLILP